MPKAAPFNPTNRGDYDFAVKFVADALSAASSKSYVVDNGYVRQEPPDGWMIPRIGILHQGRLHFMMARNEPALPQGVLFDPGTSEIHVLDLPALHQAVSSSLASPHSGLVCKADQNFIDVGLLIEWASSAGIITKTYKGKVDGAIFPRHHAVSRAGSEQFCHLHVHSMYSLLDGAASIDGLADRALLNGQPGIALTDHGYMFGTWKFYKACKDRGVKPILGVEAYLVDDLNSPYVHEENNIKSVRRFEHHITILVMNDQGWRNLCWLMSQACEKHFYYVPRIDHAMLLTHSEGLIILSGCFKGPVAWWLQDHGPDLPWWYKRHPDKSRQIIRQYKQVLGDRFYVEVQSIDYDRYMKAVPEIVQMAREEGVPCVVTNDCHYEVAEDAYFQSMLTRVSQNKVDEIGTKLQKCYFIKSATEIDNLGGLLSPDMYSRTCEIMDRCNFDFPNDPVAIKKGKKQQFFFPHYRLERDPDWQHYVQSKVTA